MSVTTYSKFGYHPGFSHRKEITAKSIVADLLKVDGRVVPGGPSNVIYIDQAKIDDGFFDAPLVSDKVYIIDGQLDITGYSFDVPATGLSLEGLGFNVSSVFTSEENAVIFSSPEGGSGDLLFKDLAFTCVGTGSKVFAITDVDGTHAFEFQRVNFNGCVDLGYVDGYRQGLEQGTGRFGGTPTLEFRGTWAGGYFMDTSIVRGISDSVYSLFGCAIGQTFASRFYTNANIVVPANVTAFTFSASNFVNDETLQINGAQFAGPGTVLAGIDQTNTRTRVSTTRGYPNTYVGAFWQCTATTATTFTLINTVTKMLGTTTGSNLEWFSLPGNNDITYDSTELVSVYATFNGSFIGGNNKDFTIRFRVWDDSGSVYVNYSSVRFSTDGNGNYVNLTMHSPRIRVAENDRIEVWVENNSDTSNLTMQTDAQLFVQEAQS